MTFGHEVLLAILGSAALSTTISALVAVLNNREKKKHGTAAGTRVLLYDRIKHRGKSYIANGEVDAESLEDLIEMHRIYHDELDGNGYLDTLMEQVKHLPIKS